MFEDWLGSTACRSSVPDFRHRDIDLASLRREIEIAYRLGEGVVRIEESASPRHLLLRASSSARYSAEIWALMPEENTSAQLACFDTRASMLELISKADPDLPVSKLIRARSGTASAQLSIGAKRYAVQLFSRPAGIAANSADITSRQRISLGSFMARIHLAGRISAPYGNGSAGGTLDGRVADALANVRHLKSRNTQRLSRAALTKVQSRRSMLASFPHCYIHGALAPQHVYVDPEEADQIIGLAGFCCWSWEPRVVDIAIAAAGYLATSLKDSSIDDILKGYLARTSLLDEEIETAPLLVNAELAILATSMAAAIADQDYRVEPQCVDRVVSAIKSLA